MSDPIIAAIITGSLGLAGVLFVNWRRTHSDSQPIPAIEPVSQITKPAQTHLSSEPARRRTTDLSHKQISDAIESVPPFQQAKIRESFVGAYVTWHTRLYGIDHGTDRVTVSAKIPEGDGVLFCRASPEDCDGFIIAPEGTKFIVTGQIERISRYEAELIHCTFEIPPKAVA